MIFGHRQPSERDCIVEAERRNMTVPAYDQTELGWRVVFARKDGTALLLLGCNFSEPYAFVCPTVAVAMATGADVLATGYGVIPYDFLSTLLDRFATWDGADALSELL